MHSVAWQRFGMPSSCPWRPMARTQWLDAIVASWFASSKLSSSRCYAFGACHIKLTLSSKMQLPCFNMGNGSRSPTSGACTCVAKRNSSWIWTVRCAQRRWTDGCTSMACSSSTYHTDAISSNILTPMRTSSCHWPSGGRSCSLPCQRLTRSTRPSSTYRIDRSSSSN